MKEIRYDLYMHISGVVLAESEKISDVTDAIFLDGYNGEIQDVSTEPHYYGTKGFIEVLSEDED